MCDTDKLPLAVLTGQKAAVDAEITNKTIDVANAEDRLATLRVELEALESVSEQYGAAIDCLTATRSPAP